MRGYFDGAAQVFAAVRSAVILSPCASQPNARANCGAPQLILKKRHGICCATEGWARNFAAHAASKTGLSISTASNIDWRWSLMAVCTGSPAHSQGLGILNYEFYILNYILRPACRLLFFPSPQQSGGGWNAISRNQSEVGTMTTAVHNIEGGSSCLSILSKS